MLSPILVVINSDHKNTFDNPMHSEKIKVILFDDNDVLRESLQELLADSEEVTLVAQFESCDNLLHHVNHFNPDVIIMDIEMPGMNGIEAVHVLRQSGSQIPILMQTVFEDQDSIFNAIKAGANGYLLKNSKFDDILKAIKDVFHGGSPLSGEIAKKVLLHLQAESSTKIDYKLTPKEGEVLQYLVNGLPYKQIAGKMNITYDTVRSHMKKIYEKLHVSSMTEAVIVAVKDKLV